MVKVLHVCKTFYPESVGAAERYIYNICKATGRHGVSHTVFCTTRSATKETSIMNGITVIKYPKTLTLSSWSGPIGLLLKFKEEAQHADVIHYHYPWPFSYLLALFAAGKQTFVTYHSDIARSKIFSWLLCPIEWCFLSSVDKVISTSDYCSRLRSSIRQFSNKTETVPMTISKDDYLEPNLSVCQGIQRRLGRFYLFIGQPRHCNGLDVLLEAMRDLFSVRLVVICDGATAGFLQKICARHQLENVVFISNVSEQDKANYLQACFGIISPANSDSISEVPGLSLFEGAMFQKPLISCSANAARSDCASYINKHLETGLVVPQAPEHLRAAMLKLIKAPNLAYAMGARALQRFETQFNYDLIGRRLAELYEGTPMKDERAEMLVEELSG